MVFISIEELYMKYNLFIFIINKEKKQILENLVYSAKKDYSNNKISQYVHFVHTGPKRIILVKHGRR